MVFVSLFLIATVCLAGATLAHPARSPHRLFKIISPEPSQALSRGYEWVGFVKSDLGCGWVSAALSGFMVVGIGWLGWLSLMSVGWLIWWLVVVGCAVGWGRVVGGFFFLFYYSWDIYFSLFMCLSLLQVKTHNPPLLATTSHHQLNVTIHSMSPSKQQQTHNQSPNRSTMAHQRKISHPATTWHNPQQPTT